MYRVENKYNCSGTEMYLLQQRVETVLHPDTNESNPEGYSVVSLYFDDLQDSCLQETVDGVNLRDKYRPRRTAGF